MQILSWPQTPLGPLWAEMDTQKRLTSLRWGTAPASAEVQRDHPLWQPLQDYFSGKPATFQSSSFAPKGTPYQQKVWDALLQIPHGQTLTYAALAKKLGTHARAIGGAVGSNPLPIFIPCHRVMGSSGKLTGFSAPGGVTTKSWLLQHEGVLLS